MMMMMMIVMVGIMHRCCPTMETKTTRERPLQALLVQTVTVVVSVLSSSHLCGVHPSYFGLFGEDSILLFLDLRLFYRNCWTALQTRPPATFLQMQRSATLPRGGDSQNKS